jgi:hypothetical protein
MRAVKRVQRDMGRNEKVGEVGAGWRSTGLVFPLPALRRAAPRAVPQSMTCVRSFKQSVWYVRSLGRRTTLTKRAQTGINLVR